MKEKLLNNIGIKLLSMFLAIIAWIIIVNLEDPLTYRTLTNLPVEIINADSIKMLDKVYEIVEGNTVNIYIEGKTSIVDLVKKSDFKMTADLSTLTPPWDSVKIWVECPKYDSYNENDFRYSLGKKNVLKVSLEDKSTAQFPITVTTTGQVEDGYAIGIKKAKPNMIEVMGAESQIERIAEVRIVMDVPGANDKVTQTVEPKAYDKNGKLLDSSKFEFSTTSVVGTVNVLETKTVPIYVNTVGTPLYGYTVTDIEYEPKQIQIAGNSADIAEINFINVEVDVTSEYGIVEAEPELALYLPEGIRLTEDIVNVTIQVTIDKMNKKGLTMETSQIEIRNLSPDYEVGLITSSISGMLNVTVMGLDEDLAVVAVEDLKPYIDLTDYNPGTYPFTVQFEKPENVDITFSPLVTVNIIDPNAEPDIEDEPPDNLPVDEGLSGNPERDEAVNGNSENGETDTGAEIP